MKITPRNLPYHNLVGLEIEVVQHPDEGLRGTKGRIIGETKNFLIIDIDKEGTPIKVQKLGYFEFTLPSGERVLVSADLIRGRPEERLKRFLRA